MADLDNLYIEGAISSAVEDVEGNQFDPNDMDVQEFLSNGFLDIDHLFHKYGMQESVIGKPVSVWKEGKRLFGRFKLMSSEFCREIHDYVKAHPGVLSFSIAGPLEKPLFGRGGKWKLLSCALTHSPMQPDAYTVALSATGHTMSLYSIMSAFVADVRHGTIRNNTPLADLYQYFKAMAGPVQGFELATFAFLKMHEYRAPTDIMSQLRDNLFYDENMVETFALETKGRLAEWKLFHPEDEHITRTGQFRSPEDAVTHFRYCERLNPIQVATIMGRLRGRGDVVHGWGKLA